MRLSTLIFGGLLALAAAPALGQVPPDIATKNHATGHKIDGPGVNALYAPLHKPNAMEAKGLRVDRDIAYGPGPMEKLDVVAMNRAAGRPLKPVLIFVHGGAFTGGDKAQTAGDVRSPFYDNLMLWAAQHGMVGINVNYELAPKATYPTAQQSLARVVDWAKKNALANGGDPNRIFLMGHSAGAAHVAAYIAEPAYYPASGLGLKGAILVSSSFSADGATVNPYFVPEDRYGKLDFTPGLIASKIPLLIATSELDAQFAIDGAALFLKAAANAPVKPRSVILKDHNHLSEIYAVGTGDKSLSSPIEQFVLGTK